VNVPTYPTVPHALEARARATPNKVAVTYGGEPLTFGDLWREAERAAMVYQRAGVRAGDRVVLALPNGLAFFPAFYGVHLARAIAVPVFPGAAGSGLAAVAARCGARALVVADGRTAEVDAHVHPNTTSLSPTALRGAGAPPATVCLPAPSDVAFIQYTSGSTGEPKGVVLRHAALATNVQQLIVGMAITTDERFVSWLPVYHDMGLILKTMVPMFLGAETHLLRTSLRDVNPWLDAIERIRGTFTAAPDFGWRLCLRRSLHRRYDLSSLRVALNAAEPVRAETVRAFEERFGLRCVMTAGYGLAEATVGVSMTRPGHAPSVDAQGAVSVGLPFPNVEIRVRRDGRPCPPGEPGTLHVRTTARCDGYFADPQATAALFDEEGFLDTGDVGYLDARGMLFILGRVKNSIIVAGRTLAPREIEEAAESHSLVRFAAALGIDRKAPGDRAGEQLVVVVEMRAPSLSRDALDDATRAIIGSIQDRIGMRPAELVLVVPNTIPQTHNGKIQHAELRAQHLAGSLAASGRVLRVA
jgi:acyl-CoA synthetase (AMP-forming)/AMP-acid ligase II